MKEYIEIIIISWISLSIINIIAMYLANKYLTLKDVIMSFTITPLVFIMVSWIALERTGDIILIKPKK